MLINATPFGVGLGIDSLIVGEDSLLETSS